MHGKKRNAFKGLVGKLKGQRPPERCVHCWWDNIKVCLGETGWEGMDWISLAQNRDQQQTSVNTVINL